MSRSRSGPDDLEREIERLRIDQETLAAMLLKVRSNIDATTLSIDRQQLDDSRDTLLRKRQSQNAACLPRTTAILEKTFFQEYRSFAESYQPSGSKASLDEAIAFSRHVQTKHVLEGWKADAARYDLLLCRWKRHRYMLTTQWLRYDVPSWSTERAELPCQKSLLVIAWRFGKLGKIHLLYRKPFFRRA